MASPLLANIYMHRFIKAFRKYGLDRRYGAVLVTYADDFVVLCRHDAAAVLETTRRWMTSIGLALNETKTRVCDARCESFDFLGYTFGPMHSPRTGGRYNGARPSAKAVASIKERIRQRLRPTSPMARWRTHGTRCSGICTRRSVAFSAGGITSPVLASGSSRHSACSGNWVCMPSNHLLVGALRMPPHDTRPRAG